VADTDVTGNVTLKGDAKGLVVQYKLATDFAGKLDISLEKNARALAKQAEAAKKAEQALFVHSARMENARQRAADLDATFGKAGTQFDKATRGMGNMTAGANKLAPAVGFVARTAATGSASIGGMVSAVISATSAFGPWGLAAAAVGSALYGLASSQIEAAEAAKQHTEELKKQKREMERLASEERSRKVVERLQKEHEIDQARTLAAENAPHEEAIRQKEREIASSRDSLEIRLHEIQIMKEQAEIALNMGDLDERARLLHQADLAELRLTVGEEKKRTAEKQKQTELEALLGPGADKRFEAMVKRAQEAREAEAALFAPEEDDETMKALDEQFKSARQGFEQAQEEEKRAAHERFKAMKEEEQRLREEEIKDIERTAAAGSKAAQMAVGGLMDVVGARRDAIRQARLQGKSEKEAAEAGKIATLIALESQLKSLRNMAAMHAIEYLAKGIASQASTYGIPNPQSIGYFTSAGIFTGLAAAGGAAAFAVGNSADSAQMGASGGDNGFGAGSGGFGGGGGSSRGSGGGGQRGVDSEIPGSPTPQPKGMWQQQTPAQTVINIENVYGTPRRDFIRQITEGQRDLGYSEAS
jgi:hypothetical protein